MLQQTQVATVIPYYERWLARFPDIASLACASEDEVLAAWQGLGYYRRARMLLAGARYMLESTSSQLPRTAAGLRHIPGIGPYTSGAIASIAYGEPAALVDGNVERVFARVTGCEASDGALNKAAWDWAAGAVHQTRPGDWNQALMELGATTCKPTDPLCGQCPLATHCEANRLGLQGNLPSSGVKKQVVALTHYVWVPLWQNSFGIRQVPAGQWWAGMWEFPRTESLAELERILPNVWSEEVGRFRHSVTHHRIEVKVSLTRVEEPHPDLTWVELDKLPTYALPSPQKKALNMVRNHLGHTR